VYVGVRCINGNGVCGNRRFVFDILAELSRRRCWCGTVAYDEIFFPSLHGVYFTRIGYPLPYQLIGRRIKGKSRNNVRVPLNQSLTGRTYLMHIGAPRNGRFRAWQLTCLIVTIPCVRAVATSKRLQPSSLGDPKYLTCRQVSNHRLHPLRKGRVGTSICLHRTLCKGPKQGDLYGTNPRRGSSALLSRRASVLEQVSDKPDRTAPQPLWRSVFGPASARVSGVSGASISLVIIGGGA